MTTAQHPSSTTQLVNELAQAVRAFVDEFVIPHEAELAAGGEVAAQLEAQLTQQAREAGLWGCFYPPSHGGKITKLEDYLLVAEQEGRTEFSQAIFGSHSALDAHMMLEFGTPEIQQHFLEPMAAGLAVSSYGMTEPDHGGSFPSLISTSAQLENGQWRINGRKWFVCNTDKADFVTVLARVAEDSVAIQNALSMILVPTDTPGFKVERHISLLGRSLGQGEMSFTDVCVPAEYLLGKNGNGIAMMGRRLGMGRLLRAMNWLGLAQRCFDLMGLRIQSGRGISARLPDKQLVRQHAVNAYQAIASARALVQAAARGVDNGQRDDIAINIAKMAASQALCISADAAVQIYGAEGISDLSPVSGIYRIARTTRILDGSDEALISSVGRQLIDHYQTAGSYSFV